MTEEAKRDDPEYQRRVAQAQFLATLYEDHHDVLNRALAAIRKAATTSSVINQVEQENYDREAQKAYFYVLVGTLIVQGVPLAEAYLLANDSTTSHFRKLRLMPEPGSA